MIAEPLQQWTDRMNVTHSVRPAYDLSIRERQFLNVLRQQTGVSARLLEAGYCTPAIRQASPNMTRMMLHILLPYVDEQEIATFDSSAGDALLIHWWAITDATLLST